MSDTNSNENVRETAKGLARDGRFKDLVDFLRSNVHAVENDAELTEHMSTALYNIGDGKAAQKFAKNLVQLTPNDWRSHYIYARRSMDLDDWEPAVGALKRSDALDPNNIRVLEGLAFIARRSSDSETEEAYARKMISAEPQNWMGHFFLARALSDQRKSGEALSEIGTAQSLHDGDSFPLIDCESHILKSLGRREEALNVALAAASAFPNLARAHFLVGRRQVDTSRFEEACETLERALKINPEHKDGHKLLIEAATLARDGARAEKAARSYREIAFEDGTILLANALLDFEGPEAAIEVYNDALTQSSSDLLRRELVMLALATNQSDLVRLHRTEFLNAVSPESKPHFAVSSARVAFGFDSNEHLEAQQRYSGQLNGSMFTTAELKHIARNHNVYTMTDKVPGFKFYESERVSIYIMEGLSHAARLYTDYSVPDESYFFVQYPIAFDNREFERQVAFFREVTNNRFPLDRLCIMTNSTSDLEFCLSIGLSNSLFCNNNCWIDHTLFKPSDSSKKYDMVMNCRPEKDMKRPYLAAEVSNLAVIRGNLVRAGDYWPLSQLNPSYMNNHGRLSVEQVIEILNQSYCGGIFSPKEGACYASSEYLLTGLPVISTESVGGRDHWYTSDNCIIVPPETRAVVEAVKTAKDRMISGEWSAQKIREAHVAETLRFRSVFVSRVNEILSKHGDPIQGQNLLDGQYRNLFKQVSPYSGL